MGEQLLTGIEEFYMIRDSLAGYYGWFPPARADHATVLLITVVWTVCSLLFYAVLIGGTSRLVVLGLFGLFGVQEGHHIVESFGKGGYDPGVVTCIPYLIAGSMLVVAVWREFRLGRRTVPDSGAVVTPHRQTGVLYEGH